MAQVIFAFLLLTLVCPAASSTDPSEFVSLLQTRAHVVASDEAVTLDLSTVKHNNLGGFGPDSGTAEVRYGPVATLNDGTQVDLVVTTDLSSGYEQTANGNKKNFFGRLSQASGSSRQYTFSFEDSSAPGTPVTLNKVAISFFDVDGNQWQEIKETISVCGADSIALAGNSGLELSHDGDCAILAPFANFGSPNVNDADLQLLTDDQKAHTFTVSFTETASFNVNTYVSPSSSGQPENRALVFAGQEIPEFEVVYTAPVGNVQNWAFVMDSQGNLIAIKTAATGTLMTEVHRLSKASNYQEFDLQVGTCLPYASDADTWSFVMASNDDLVAIKKGPHTGTGMTEVHRMSAASNYQKFTLQTGTALHLTNDADSWSFAMDEHDDLLAIKKGPQTGTGMTEVHRLSSDSNYQSFNLQTRTALHYSNGEDSWSFVTDNREGKSNLVAIKKGPQTGSGMTEVHRMQRDENYKSFNLQKATALHYSNDAKSWSFVMDPTTGDLVAIKRGPSTGSGKTEVHRMKRKNAKYTKFNLQVATALHYSNNP